MSLSVLSVKGQWEHRERERERERERDLTTVLFFCYWLFLSGVLTALQGQLECNRKMTTLFCPLTNMAHRHRRALPFCTSDVLTVHEASALSVWERTIQNLRGQVHCFTFACNRPSIIHNTSKSLERRKKVFISMFHSVVKHTVVISSSMQRQGQESGFIMWNRMHIYSE